MRRNPVYSFQDRNSVGIFDVPLHATIHILNAGNGTPEYVEIIAKSGLYPSSTVGEFLDNPDLYIDLTNSVTNFLQLHDTPDTYVGEGNKILVIDDAETGVIYADVIDGGEYIGQNVLINQRKSKNITRISNKTGSFARKPSVRQRRR